ncbi:MAG: hypothetical protein JWL80_28 [Parcubacteria group bacterium]|nr:hypothetical protein [Parcubacteria group bacterium]
MQEKNETRIIVPALLLVLVLVGGYMYFNSRIYLNKLSPKIVETKKVEVDNLLATQQETKNIPSAYPDNFPIEKANITESYSVDYKDENIKQDSVSYTSAATKDILWKIYSDYFTANGFVIDTNATNKTNGIIAATKEKQTVSVIISVHGKVSLVQINIINK